GGAVAYTTALAACPSGSHIAALTEPDEAAAALRVAGGSTVWIGLRATSQVGIFNWDVAGIAFVPDRFHGFIGGDPGQDSVPICTIVDGARGGWRERACTQPHVPL